MRNVRILLAALAASLFLSGCGAVQNAQENAQQGVDDAIADANQAVDDAAAWLEGQIPWNKRVPLLEFGTAPDTTLNRGLRALDQVNPIATSPKFLASLRAPLGMEPRAKLVECDNAGNPTGALEERGVAYWDFELSRLRIDMVNYQCYSTHWYADFEANRGQLEVTLRALWAAVVGYAHYMSDPNGLPSEQRSVSCVAGLLLWQLTQPFVLMDQTEPPYLSPAQAQVVLRYVKLRKSQIGNQADDGFQRHNPGGCKA